MMFGFLADEEKLLQHVDEYTLYCKYLEFEPEIKLNYNSPLRAGDESPSFGIYNCKKPNREFMWKDSGDKGNSGDIFKLIKLLYGYETSTQVLARIMSDFALGPDTPQREKIVKHAPVVHSDADYRIRSRAFRAEDLTWWQQFNITEELLKRYRTSALYCYWLNPKQRVPVFTPGLSFVYRVYDRYQLYFPQQPKGKKFRNDLQQHHVFGMEQLTYQGPLIITKSNKDVMTLRSFGYDSVAPRSENTPMPPDFFAWADAHYQQKYVMFDNDMKHRGEWYPYKQIYVPLETGSKDISDFTRDYSPRQASELLQTLVA